MIDIAQIEPLVIFENNESGVYEVCIVLVSTAKFVMYNVLQQSLLKIDKLASWIPKRKSVKPVQQYIVFDLASNLPPIAIVLTTCHALCSND